MSVAALKSYPIETAQRPCMEMFYPVTVVSGFSLRLAEAFTGNPDNVLAAHGHPSG